MKSALPAEVRLDHFEDALRRQCQQRGRNRAFEDQTHVVEADSGAYSVTVADR